MVNRRRSVRTRIKEESQEVRPLLVPFWCRLSPCGRNDQVLKRIAAIAPATLLGQRIMITSKKTRKRYERELPQKENPASLCRRFLRVRSKRL